MRQRHQFCNHHTNLYLVLHFDQNDSLQNRMPLSKHTLLYASFPQGWRCHSVAEYVLSMSLWVQSQRTHTIQKSLSHRRISSLRSIPSSASGPKNHWPVLYPGSLAFQNVLYTGHTASSLLSLEGFHQITPLSTQTLLHVFMEVPQFSHSPGGTFGFSRFWWSLDSFKQESLRQF
jgi:hypothetical protein